MTDSMMQFRGHWFRLRSAGGQIVVSADDGDTPPEVVEAFRTSLQLSWESVKARFVDGERAPEELMKETRLSLTAKVLKYREHASHPYIARLEAENAALREIAAAVADGEPYYLEQPEGWHCQLCDGWQRGDWTNNTHGGKDAFAHDADCPVTRARALLAPKDDGDAQS